MSRRAIARNASRAPAAAVAFSALVWIPGIVRAEVGVPLGPPGTGNQRGPILIGIIGDSPDPIQPVWKELSTPGSGMVPLNTKGYQNGDGPPTFVVHPVSGDPIVLWSRNSATGFDIVGSRFANGEWTVPTLVAGGPSNDLDPSIAVAPDGTLHVAYWTDGAEKAVWHIEGAPDLTSWSAPSRVSDTGWIASRPSAVFHGGFLRIAYEYHPLGYGVSPKAIVLSRSESDSFVREVVAMTNHTGDPRPFVGSHSGRLWIDWVDAETATGAGEIAWLRLGTGGWDPIRYTTFASPFDREFHERPGIRLRVVSP